MNVIDLLSEIGISYIRTASTHGGEYHSACPECGGKDRFCVWPKQGNHGSYWCRQCQRRGDAIQFCRDFLKMSFQEACLKLGRQPTFTMRNKATLSTEFEPITTEMPCNQWLTKAAYFAQNCHQELLHNPIALKLLQMRGLTKETAERFLIGYHNQNRWEERSEWGLTSLPRDDGKQRKQWLPKGLVIPSYNNFRTIITKTKIRRVDWHERDKFPKYVEISGSQKQYTTYGIPTLPIVLVEAELDALLIFQEAGKLCCAMALGGAGKRPDFEIDQFLRKAPTILYSLDFDEAGKKEFVFWRNKHPHIVAWPAPIEKSPSEAFLKGVSLNDWITAGLKRALKSYGTINVRNYCVD